MKKYFKPLGVFVSGQFVLLIVFLLFSFAGSQIDNLAADTAAYHDTFWNLSWLTNSTVWQLGIYIGIELVTLFSTAVVFIKTK